MVSAGVSSRNSRTPRSSSRSPGGAGGEVDVPVPVHHRRTPHHPAHRACRWANMASSSGYYYEPRLDARDRPAALLLCRDLRTGYAQAGRGETFAASSPADPLPGDEEAGRHHEHLPAPGIHALHLLGSASSQARGRSVTGHCRKRWSTLGRHFRRPGLQPTFCLYYEQDRRRLPRVRTRRPPRSRRRSSPSC